MTKEIDNKMIVHCIMCNKKSEHYLHYSNDNTDWEGYYCNEHFLDKIKGLRWVWNRKLGKKK